MDNNPAIIGYVIARFEMITDNQTFINYANEKAHRMHQTALEVFADVQVTFSDAIAQFTREGQVLLDNKEQEDDYEM